MYRYMGLITYWEIYASLSGLCIQIRDSSCKITKSLTLRNQSETAIYNIMYNYTKKNNVKDISKHDAQCYEQSQEAYSMMMAD